MRLFEVSINRPVSTFMIFLAIIVAGIYSLTQLPLDFFPEFELPALTLITSYRGADAQSVEENITKPLEEQLSSINRLKKITSTSNENISIITMEFEYGTNLDDAANDVRDVIDRTLTFLPEDVERPALFKISSSMMPIMVFSVNSTKNYEGIKEILEYKVINSLNRLEGVAGAFIFGAPQRVIYIDIDINKLESFNITLPYIANFIKSQNFNLPIGNIKTNYIEYRISVDGKFKNSEDIKNLLIPLPNGKNIYLKEIANVKDTLLESTFIESINKSKGVRLAIFKQAGYNTVKVANKVNKELEKIKKNLPEDIKISEIFDSSKLIYKSINNLSQTLLFAFIFVSLVVLFFTGKYTQSIIILTTIPISLFASFIFTLITGNTLNIITLSALIIAIGMVVDDAIVVVENITKHLERGSTVKQACVAATNEVFIAVIATTVVIVIVFAPLSLIKGLIGEIFRPLGWIVSITIIVSTITAISFIPALSSKILKSPNYNKNKNLWIKYIKNFLDNLENFYQYALKFFIKKNIIAIIFIVLASIISVWIISVIGKDFIPLSDRGIINGNIYIQTGVSLKETEKVIKKLEKIVSERYPEINRTVFSAGTSSSGTITGAFSSNSNSIINIFFRLKDLKDRKRSVFEIIEDFRHVLDTMPEIIKYDFSSSSSSFLGSSNTVDIKIFCHDLNYSRNLAHIIKDSIKKISGARDIKISLENENPQFKIYLKNEKLAQLNLNTFLVSNELRNYITGFTVTKYSEKGNEYDVIIRLNEKARNNINAIENLFITLPNGQKIKLKEIAEVKETLVPPSITRENKQRIVKISVAPEKVSLTKLSEEILNKIKKINILPDAEVVLGGAFQDQQEAFLNLIYMFFVSIILVYLTMAAQFESFVIPIIILSVIPFIIPGVLIALFLTNTTLSVNAAVGIIMLVGIVTKNSIVLVDYINILINRGQNIYSAIINAGKSRLRPILMTAITTLLGVLPMALSTGEMSEQWKPIGISVIGGLFFTTFISLIIVPSIYFLLKKRKNKNSL